MSHCCRNHKSRSHDHHSHDERPGVIRRVTRGLAKKFGVPRKLVLAGFIIGLIINVPLTIFLFLVALYWVDHPGQLEKKMERVAEKSRRFWSHFGDRGHRPAYAGAESPNVHEDSEEFDFADLRQQFDDLERRAGNMEEHVSSGEFHVNREIDGMREGDARKR
jgi:phage shock protein PspC (stress-responsive transcriptional regulator)